MYGVELYAAVRLAVVDEGLSHHEAGRRFGIDRRTVKKMLSYSAPPGYRRTKPVRPAQAGRVHRHRRRDPGGGHGSGRAAQAASHGAPDLRAATGRARVHRRLYHREGLCPGPAAIDARGFRAAASPAGPCPGRLRRGGGGGRGQAGEGCLLLPDSCPIPTSGSSRPIRGRRRRPSSTAMSAPSPSSAVCRDRSSMTTRRLRWHGSWGDGTRRRTQAFTHLQSHYLFRDRFGRPRQGQRQGQGRGPGEDGTAPGSWCRSRRCMTCRS